MYRLPDKVKENLLDPDGKALANVIIGIALVALFFLVVWVVTGNGEPLLFFVIVMGASLAFFIFLSLIACLFFLPNKIRTFLYRKFKIG